MDGFAVIDDAFEDGWLADNPVELAGEETLNPTGPSISNISPEEEQLLMERQRGLGYMG